jgi:hypothetical protein
MPVATSHAPLEQWQDASPKVVVHVLALLHADVHAAKEGYRVLNLLFLRIFLWI